VSQKNIFLDGEADQWFLRNVESTMSNDLILDSFQDFSSEGGSLLEIGCSDGKRLEKLKNHYGFNVHGIEPSDKAVSVAISKGLNVQKGTAESLPYDNQIFDVVIYGFCLYLCDREDLFRIAYEGDRVLREGGLLVILDFDPGMPCLNDYHHLDSILAYKMDYSKMFTWNSAYTIESKKFFGLNKEAGLLSDRNDRKSVTRLIKNSKNAYISCESFNK
tara:strand:- start:414 stop:1067 length:654 start_codon:yes stop_codon:yes gene_type:complete